MKGLISYGVLFLAAMSVVGITSGAEGEMIVSPAKRQEILDQAKSLLAAKAMVLPGKDPFHSETETIAGGPRGGENQVVSPGDNSGPIKAAAPTGPRSARDLLQAIATSPSLKPSGYFVLGGQPTLVFGQKRVKAGSLLKITFEGTDYDIEIVSIERPNFTLRLNREEFTRPIK